LSLQEDIRKLAARLATEHSALDVLVNNAGILSRGRRRVTAEGIEMQLAVNHLAPFLLTRELRPLLEAAEAGRVVTVASDAHRMARKVDLDDIGVERRRYGSFRRYAETKAMNILFTQELARRLEGTAVTANCLHPGGVSTNLGNPPALLAPLTRVFLKSAHEGAATSIHLAASPDLAGVTGGYFSNLERISPSAVASDAETARRLWERSEELARVA
jgi:NAD(P)-dependent dehydrogenase (short-subunit alcohol dehydrogenase family)